MLKSYNEPHHNLNRGTAPRIYGLDQATLPSFQHKELANGIKLYSLLGEEDKVVLMKLYFRSGWANSESSATAELMVNLLSKGTLLHDEEWISAFNDYRGSIVRYSLLPDYTQVGIQSLKEHFVETLTLVLETLTQPAFHPLRIERMKQKLCAQYAIVEQESAYIAKQGLYKALYGNQKYGNQIASTDFAHITREDIQRIHAQVFCQEGCFALIAGDVEEATLQFVENSLSTLPLARKPLFKSLPKVAVSPQKHTTNKLHLYPMEGKTQNSLAIGCHLPCTLEGAGNPFLHYAIRLLGGFFSSRLMQTLREEKGYTYGVYSGIVMLREGAHLSINTEIKQGSEKESLAIIRQGIESMSTLLANENELESLKGFCSNWLLRSFDGIFNSANFLSCTLLIPWLSMNFANNLIRDLEGITAEILCKTSQAYLQYDTMHCVIAGSELPVHLDD